MSKQKANTSQFPLYTSGFFLTLLVTKLTNMKKSLIGAVVGGIIIFIWQFISWGAVNLHKPAQQYTPKQDAVMAVLNNNLEEGGYYIPNLPDGASTEEQQKAMQEMAGKPWATVQYHKSMDTNMTMNMIRGFITNVITVWLLCWILLRLKNQDFGTIFTASLFTGLIIFLNVPYVYHIWYQSFDLMAHFLDAIVSWGITGLFLAWWLPRNVKRVDITNRSVSNVEHLNA